MRLVALIILVIWKPGETFDAGPFVTFEKTARGGYTCTCVSAPASREGSNIMVPLPIAPGKCDRAAQQRKLNETKIIREGRRSVRNEEKQGGGRVVLR